MLVEVLAVDVVIKVVDALGIALEFDVLASCSVDVLSGMAIDVSMDALTGMPTGIGVDVFVDVNLNLLTGVLTVKFAMSMPFEEFNC